MDKTSIFKTLKSLMARYNKNLEIKADTEDKYELYGTKKVTVNKKEVDGMYFGSAIIKKNYVGLYFFPIYTHPGHFKGIPEELRKCLKGKSCFHIKKNDENLNNSIDEMLRQGKALYEQEGWV